MKSSKTLVIAALVALSLALTACAGAPVAPTVSPSATPSVAASPTPVVIYEEDIAWPAQGMATLLPPMAIMLDTMMQQDETAFFASFTEYDGQIIVDYKTALIAAGYNVVLEDGDNLYSASKEDSDGLLTVQLYYESGMGTIQLSDQRE